MLVLRRFVLRRCDVMPFNLPDDSEALDGVLSVFGNDRAALADLLLAERSSFSSSASSVSCMEKDERFFVLFMPQRSF